MADLRVPHLARRQPDRLAARPSSVVCGYSSPEPVEHRRRGELDGVARARRARSPSRRGSRALREGSGCLANRGERVDVERGAADEGAVDVRLRQQLARRSPASPSRRRARGTSSERLDQRVRLLRQLGRRVAAGADRPDRLVGDRRVGRVASHGRRSPRPGLAARARSRRPRALDRLADAGDHVRPAASAARARLAADLVGLAEELPPLRVPDERAVRRRSRAASARRDLARVRAPRLPVRVLRERRDRRGAEPLAPRPPRARRYGGQTTTSTPSSVRLERSSRTPCVSAGPLNIFQLPAISTARILGNRERPHLYRFANNRSRGLDSRTRYMLRRFRSAEAGIAELLEPMEAER